MQIGGSWSKSICIGVAEESLLVSRHHGNGKNFVTSRPAEVVNPNWDQYSTGE